MITPAVPTPRPALRSSDSRAPGISRQAWLLTFTDLVSLLLTFFVLLFSMSTLEIEKWQAIAAALSRSLDGQVHGAATAEPGRFAVGTQMPRRALDLDYLSSVLAQVLRETPLAERLVIRRDGDRLLVSVPSDLAFASGSAELSHRALQTLLALAAVLRSISNQVGCEGHADPAPVRGSRFASNWELSLARAESVAAVVREIDSRRDIVARGFADSRYAAPTVPDATGQVVLPRRVDIVILQPSRQP
jgi:chemotaxis protein MotB